MSDKPSLNDTEMNAVYVWMRNVRIEKYEKAGYQHLGARMRWGWEGGTKCGDRCKSLDALCPVKLGCSGEEGVGIIIIIIMYSFMLFLKIGARSPL